MTTLIVSVSLAGALTLAIEIDSKKFKVGGRVDHKPEVGKYLGKLSF
jgi:hypothetical protein